VKLKFLSSQFRGNPFRLDTRYINSDQLLESARRTFADALRRWEPPGKANKAGF
jgi:hypothetical protein